MEVAVVHHHRLQQGKLAPIHQMNQLRLHHPPLNLRQFADSMRPLRSQMQENSLNRPGLQVPDALALHLL